jgi:hypothetical protein
MDASPLLALSSLHPITVPAGSAAALQLLVEADRLAHECRRDTWQFAVELPTFEAARLTNNDLRWLLCQGLAEHGVEITPPQSPEREFDRLASLAFTVRSCFVLSERGSAWTKKHLNTENGLTLEVVAADAVRIPCWDRTVNELRYGGVVVKRFKQPARNQVLVLEAFQEECWPPQIDDPLAPDGESDPKKRLHDTIGRLNRHQQEPLIRFHGNGNGDGVLWERLD